MIKLIPYSPSEVDASLGFIHASKFRYLVDFRTLTTRISKMQMQIIIERFLRSEKSKEYKLHAYEKLILTMLASRMGDKLNCWPSHKKLSEDCSLSHDSLSKYITLLENKKLLIVIKKINKNNEYEFTQSILDFIADIPIKNHTGQERVPTRQERVPTRQERVPTRWERVRVHAGSVSNNINNNINNNKQSYPQAKEWEGLAETADKPSSILEDYDKDKLCPTTK
jgi:predicted transcriptional regulator